MLNINLIAERRARKLREMISLRWSIIGLALLMLLMLGLNITVWFDLRSNRNDLKVQSNLLVELKAEYTVLQKINQEISEMGPIVKLLDEVRISEQTWMIVLADISLVIPHNASIENITTLGGKDGIKLRFSGEALDQDTVGAFMESFSQQTLWADPADLGQISASRNKADGQRVRYDFSVPVRGMLGGDL